MKQHGAFLALICMLNTQVSNDLAFIYQMSNLSYLIQKQTLLINFSKEPQVKIQHSQHSLSTIQDILMDETTHIKNFLNIMSMMQKKDGHLESRISRLVACILYHQKKGKSFIYASYYWLYVKDLRVLKTYEQSTIIDMSLFNKGVLLSDFLKMIENGNSVSMMLPFISYQDIYTIYLY